MSALETKIWGTNRSQKIVLDMSGGHASALEIFKRSELRQIGREIIQPGSL